MKSKILMLFMMVIVVGLATMTSCGDDDGTCKGVYDSQNECKDAIRGADNCECEEENGLWIAVPEI